MKHERLRVRDDKDASRSRSWGHGDGWSLSFACEEEKGEKRQESRSGEAETKAGKTKKERKRWTACKCLSHCVLVGSRRTRGEETRGEREESGRMRDPLCCIELAANSAAQCSAVPRRCLASGTFGEDGFGDVLGQIGRKKDGNRPRDKKRERPIPLICGG